MTAAAGATAGVGCAKSAQNVSMMHTPRKTTKKTPTQAKTDHKVPVAIRMRPLRPSEGHSGRVWRVDAAGSKILQTNQGGEHEPGMDAHELAHTFDEGASNRDVYDALGQGIVRDVLNGYNGTIFTYGQTSSGKTHTMQGSGECSGLLQLAASDIFSHVEKERASSEAAQDVFDLGDEEETSYAVKVSFIEIYNESFRDLLVSADANESARGFRATERVVNHMDELLQALAEGGKNRSVGSTKMNDRSSRSHAIFSIAIESNDASATLNLVDLAGSESVRHTGATGERKKEAGYINQSLLALQRVVTQLGANASAKGKGGAHVPYRDSKLTEFLQPSLAGASKLAVVCCATPSELHETRSTLQFAARTGRVETRAVKNRVSLARRWSVAPATPLGTNGRASLVPATTSKKAKRGKVPGILSPKRVWGMLSPPPSKKKARSKTEGRPRAKQNGLFASIPEDPANDDAAESALQKDLRIAELEAQLKASQEELVSTKAKLQDETKDMKAEVEWLKAERDELKTQVDMLVTDGEFANAETQAKLKAAEDELEVTKTKLCEVQAEAERLRMDNKSAKMKLDGRHVEMECLRAKNDELKSQVERLRMVEASTLMKLDGCETEMERLRVENDELKLQIRKELANVVVADDQSVPAMVSGRLETEDRRESCDSDATKELAAAPEAGGAREVIAEELERTKVECVVLGEENARLQGELGSSKAKISMLEQELIKATAESETPPPLTESVPDATMLSENDENEAPNVARKPSNGKKRTNLGKAFQTMKSPVTRRRGARQRRKTDFLLNSNAAAPSASAKAEKKEPESNIVSVQKRKPNKTASKRGTNAKELAYKTIRVGRVKGYPVVVTQGKSEHEAILLGCDDGDPRQLLARNADGKVKIKWIIAGYNDKVSPTMVRLHPGE